RRTLHTTKTDIAVSLTLSASRAIEGLLTDAFATAPDQAWAVWQTQSGSDLARDFSGRIKAAPTQGLAARGHGKHDCNAASKFRSLAAQRRGKQISHKASMLEASVA